MDIPVIKVGIMTDLEVSCTLKGDYLIEHLAIIFSGILKVKVLGSGICLVSGDQSWMCPDRINFRPLEPLTSSFILPKVTIGIDFHWERKEDQVFKGSLGFMRYQDTIQVINEISIEEYLVSVISSEMSATASLEFLKAHAVISRSWLLAQIQKNKRLKYDGQEYQTTFGSADELIRWYDREDHLNFDVCADDHCQRYQGITRSADPRVEQAVLQTSGEVLLFDGFICDARFSKCCGGITELFENVWEPVNHPYLQTIFDNRLQTTNLVPDLTGEAEAAAWILGNSDVFCNTSDKKILRQVLNDYDQETNNFFRWKLVYSQSELSELVKSRSGIDFGIIENMIPVERGGSGRIIKLKIVGSLRTLIVGKELQIRKILSQSHLLSSAFIVEKLVNGEDVNFILYGSGWGHGVGLCQIGAAVMGDQGYRYSEILAHYFRGAELKEKYGEGFIGIGV